MKLPAPAKINLFLKITGKRADGYHELCSLFCPVGLFDRIELTLGGREARVLCDHPQVPEDETNLAMQAAQLFLERLGPKKALPLGQPRISIQKRIPVGAGLGGGSSDAAAILKGLNRLSGEPFTMDELAALGLNLGADVPFFLYGKPAIATGIGEILEPYDGIPPWQILLVYPGFAVSTAEVYKSLNLRLTKCEKKLSNFLFKYQNFEVGQHLCNDLEAVTAAKYPEIKKIKSLLYDHGAHGALMSGSGSTVFGLFRDSGMVQAAARDLAHNKRWQIYSVEALL